MVFFESANRLVALLDELGSRCGTERRVAVARELTKIHEELRSGTLAEVAVYYREHSPRGEVTVVLAGNEGKREKGKGKSDIGVLDPQDRARALLAGGLSRRDAAAAIVGEFGIPRNEAYRMVNAL